MEEEIYYGSLEWVKGLSYDTFFLNSTIFNPPLDNFFTPITFSDDKEKTIFGYPWDWKGYSYGKCCKWCWLLGVGT